jgi:UTP:GlnB (protein PII) uridylyltransferase
MHSIRALRPKSRVLCSVAQPCRPRRIVGTRHLHASQHSPFVASAASAAPIHDEAEAEQRRVIIDNSTDPHRTLVKVCAPNRPGLLTALTALFRDHHFDVSEAKIGTMGSKISDTFMILGMDGRKVTDPAVLGKLEASLKAILASGRRVAGRPEFSRSTPYNATQIMGMVSDIFLTY